MVLSGLAPSRASAAVREAWEQTWEALDYIANALLFLLIGLALELDLLVQELGPVLLAVLAVLVARALAVLPVVWLLERVARVARVGRRNEAVLIWGGLRGGVALALALALPEELAERELLVTLTGGVVLATLLLNATTIGWLVHRLHLDEDSPVDRFLTAVARVAGLDEARRRVDELGLADAPEAVARLDAASRQAHEELDRLELDDEQQVRAVLGRALHIERTTYQSLSDQGLLPPAVTRTLLHQVDDEVDEMASRSADLTDRRRHHDAPLLRMSRSLLRWLPEPAGEDPAELAYAEASARRLAARQTRESLSVFEGRPGVRTELVERVRQTFTDWEREADAALDDLDERSGATRRELHERQAALLAEAAAARQVDELVDDGLLPERLRLRRAGGRG